MYNIRRAYYNLTNDTVGDCGMAFEMELEEI